MLLRPTGDVLLLNEEAAQTLRDRPELSLQGSRIVTRRAEEQSGLEAAVASVFATGREALFAFRTRDGVAEFAIALHKVATVDLALAIMSAVRTDSLAHPAVLSAILRLTAAETRLAQRLQAGDSLASAATRTGISIATARSTLRHVLSKSGAKTQAALAATLFRLSNLRRRART